MVYALRTPSVLLGMVIGYLAAGALRAVVNAIVDLAPGGAGLAVRRWQRWLDPFGAVAVVIVGFGWLGTTEPRRALRSLMVDFSVNLVLAMLFLAGLGLRTNRFVVANIQIAPTLHGDLVGAPFVPAVCAGAGLLTLACALLTLVPIPPLPMGVLAWSTLPKTMGARRAAYRLLEDNWGIAIVLVLIIVPLVNGESVLLALVDSVGDALLRLAG